MGEGERSEEMREGGEEVRRWGREGERAGCMVGCSEW